jgi:hypothetical protein
MEFVKTNVILLQALVICRNVDFPVSALWLICSQIFAFVFCLVFLFLFFVILVFFWFFVFQYFDNERSFIYLHIVKSNTNRLYK